MPETIDTNIDGTLADAIHTHRPRLVGLCARLSGDRDAAEDLAQETLLIAWRLRGRLHDPAGLDRWLHAIARNVCGRWRRQQGRETVHLALHAKPDPDDSLTAIPDPDDLQLELERDELAALLDRALALLPSDTRDVLIGKYVAELPTAEIAMRLGVSENAIAVRLHRGKIAFRRVLATELRDQAAAFGLIDSRDEWQTTRIWCPFCGQHKLIARVDRADGEVWFRCAGACIGPNGGIAHTYDRQIIADVRSPRSILGRQIGFLGDHYRRAIAARSVRCWQCGNAAAVHMTLAPDVPAYYQHLRGIHVRCDMCGWTESNLLSYLAFDLPVVQRFWRSNPRMYALPERAIEFGGVPAIVTSFEQVAGSARIDVISDAATFAVLDVHGASADGEVG
jgi:RNA polymerase sigma factor (sigma-70 family)